MKNRILAIILIATICIGALSISSFAAWSNSITIIDDDETPRTIAVDVAPVPADGDLLCPLRFIAESINIYVAWDEQNQAVNFNNYLFMQTDSDTAYIGSWGGTPVKMNTPATVVNGRTMAPFKFVAEQFGYICTFDEANNTIHLKNKNVISNIWDSEVAFIINGTKNNPVSVDVPPQQINDVLMFPLRVSVESLGKTMQAEDYVESAVTVTSGADIIKFNLYDPICLFNGTELSMSQAPILVDQRMLVPAVFLFELLGYSSAFDQSMGTVTLTSLSVSADKPGGAYDQPFSISLATNLSGSTILYTTDGSDPKTAGVQYTSEIIITQSTLVKACAFKNGGYSDIAQYFYAMTGTQQGGTGTDFGGIIRQTQILKREGSPYRINSNTLIDTDTTLCIEPGVEVLFAKDKYLQVRGNILAYGSAGAPVVFKGQTADRWENIHIFGQDANTTIFDTVEISGARKGIYFTAGKVENYNCKIYGNDIGYNDQSYDGLNLLKECTVSDNVYNGIQGRRMILEGCIIRNNGYNGIESNLAEISNCTITQNGLDGIHGAENNVSFSTVTFNGQNGIYDYRYDATNLITGTVVASNGVDGIVLNGASYYSGSIKITNCKIKYNGRNGILNNNFFSVSVNNCAIWGNKEYNVCANTEQIVTYKLDYKNNYWGTTDLNAIRAGNKDFYMDFNLPELLITPILIASPFPAVDPVVMWPDVKPIIYGQTFGEAINGGLGDGVFSIEDAQIASNASTTPYAKKITFTPNDTESYNVLTKDIQVLVMNASQNPPSIEVSKTKDTITIAPVAGAEYGLQPKGSMDDVVYTSSNNFTGLTPKTQYTAYIRMAAKPNYNASDPAITDVTTNQEGPPVTVDDVENVILGLDLESMEYSISTDGGATYGEYVSLGVPFLGGSKLVKVRFKAQGQNLASGDTVLAYTPNCGDVDGDGIIDISDVIMAAEIAVGGIDYTSEQVRRANVNHKTDMTVDITDVILLAERAVGGTDAFPVDLI